MPLRLGFWPEMLIIELRIQEVNSIEAIKNAVEANLGAAFVSRAAIEKEVELGRLSILTIKDLPLSRPLLCITDPGRYCSLAVRAFIRALFGLTVVTVPDGCIARLLQVCACVLIQLHACSC